MYSTICEQRSSAGREKSKSINSVSSEVLSTDSDSIVNNSDGSSVRLIETDSLDGHSKMKEFIEGKGRKSFRQSLLSSATQSFPTLNSKMFTSNVQKCTQSKQNGSIQIANSKSNGAHKRVVSESSIHCKINLGATNVSQQTQLLKSIANNEAQINSNEEYKLNGALSSTQSTRRISIFNRRFYLPKAHELPLKMGDQAINTFREQKSDMMESLHNLHSSLKNYPSGGATVAQPEGLRVNLLNHQLKGLAWLIWRESESPAGGVLADDMGLGKTLQMISLILKTNELQNGSQTPKHFYDVNLKKHVHIKGTLVLTPSSVMKQWHLEIVNKVKAGLLSVCIHHGQHRAKNISELSKYDVVLTTYGIIRKSPDNDPIKTITWFRIILDEAHLIRNHRSQTALSIFSLKANKKWVLTGTPIQNKSQDYYALLKFLDLKPFNVFSIWKKFVDNQHSSGIHRLNVICKAIMLRRTKEEIKIEDKLCGLGEKHVEIIYVKLNHDELLLYEKLSHFSKALLTQFIYEHALKDREVISEFSAKKQVVGTGKTGAFGGPSDLVRWHNNLLEMKEVKSHDIFAILLKLRQLCCHPYLVECFFHERVMKGAVNEEANNENHLERITSRLSLEEKAIDGNDCGKFITSSISRLFHKEKMSSKIREVIRCLKCILLRFCGDKIIVVSQWPSFLEILENFIVEELAVKCVYLTGKIPIHKRQQIIEDFNSHNLTHQILLLSLTAGGLGVNLVGGNHLLFVDLHWNPQLETQASDRIYRFGQSKDVHIYKFICEGTVEQRILRLQQLKLSLANGIIDGSAKRDENASKLGLNELKLLFDLECPTND